MLYQIIMQDEYNNLYALGFYKSLDEALEDVNDWLSLYEVKIDSLVEYPSTFDVCFDKEIEVDEGCVYVRGFIWDKDYLEEIIGGTYD